MNLPQTLTSSLRRTIERLSRLIGERSLRASDSRDSELEEMANDPAIQHEIREIETEFAPAEADGLNTDP